MNFEGIVHYDTSKPNGQPTRVLDIQRALDQLGFIANTQLLDGLTTTITYYRENKDQIDSLKPKYV